MIISIDHRWWSFHHASVAEFLPELRLRAPDLPARAVMLASFLHPPLATARIPGFAVLF